MSEDVVIVPILSDKPAEAPMKEIAEVVVVAPSNGAIAIIPNREVALMPAEHRLEALLRALGFNGDQIIRILAELEELKGSAAFIGFPWKLAEDMLGWPKHLNQRRVRKAHIDALEKRIHSDTFGRGNTIIIDVQRYDPDQPLSQCQVRILDGQSRLWAIARAKKSVKLTVCFLRCDSPEESLKEALRTDAQRKRSISDHADVQTLPSNFGSFLINAVKVIVRKQLDDQTDFTPDDIKSVDQSFVANEHYRDVGEEVWNIIEKSEIAPIKKFLQSAPVFSQLIMFRQKHDRKKVEHIVKLVEKPNSHPSRALNRYIIAGCIFDSWKSKAVGRHGNVQQDRNFIVANICFNAISEIKQINFEELDKQTKKYCIDHQRYEPRFASVPALPDSSW